MHPSNVFKLMDHKTGIADHYGRPTDEKLFEEYLLALDDLTIYKEPEVSQMPCFQRAMCDSDTEHTIARIKKDERTETMIRITDSDGNIL